MILIADIPGERLDAFVARSVENMSRSGAQKLLEEGCILRNGKPGKKNDKLNMGDEISVTLPEPKEVDIVATEMELDIVYEDDDVLVINKPKGLVVHPAAGHQDDTLVNGLLYAMEGNLSGINGELRPGIVLVSGSGVNNKALWFVDHQHVVILVNNVQLHLCGYDVHFLGLGQCDGNLVADIQFVVFLSGLAVSQNAAFLQQLLCAGAAHILNRTGNERIQTLTGNIRDQNHFFFSSFQNSLLIRNRCAMSKMQPQVMKQSATLNTGKSIKAVSIISTTKPMRKRSIILPMPPP